MAVQPIPPGLLPAPPRAGRALPLRRPALRPSGLARRLVVGSVTLAVLGGGGFLGAGAFALTNFDVHAGCQNRPFRAMTPLDFEASNGTGTLHVDTTVYRFADFRDVSFPARDDPVTIRAWYAPGRAGTANPLVIVVHGIDSCRADPVVMLPAAMLHRAGFGVLQLDLRNHGTSEVVDGRSTLGTAEARDVLGALDWLVARGHDPARIALYGSSLGGATATIAFGLEPRVAALWADATWADTNVLLHELAVASGYPALIADAARATARVTGSEFALRDPVDAMAARAGRPVALSIGTTDDRIALHHVRDLAAAASREGPEVVPWILPGVGHSEAVLFAPALFEARLVAFYTGAIGAPLAGSH